MIKGHRSILAGKDSKAIKAAWQKKTLTSPEDKDGFDDEA